MARIGYTRHAEQQLTRRQIASAWVERVVRDPPWTEPDPKRPGIERRFGTVPERGGRVLRVAVRQTAIGSVVVTLVFDRNARKRLKRGERP